MIIKDKTELQTLAIALNSHLRELKAEDYKVQDPYEIDVTEKLLIKTVEAHKGETPVIEESPMAGLFKYQ